MRLRQIPVQDRFWQKVWKTSTCWVWTGALRRGYGAVWIGGRRGRHVPAHRVAWELTHGMIPDGIMVLHECDNRRCVRPDPGHLYLGGHTQNMQDATDRQRMCHGDEHRRIHTAHVRGMRGERNSRAVLTQRKADTIREMYKTGKFSLNQLAAHFKVAKKTIFNTVKGHTYREDS
jgi:HNH endonuclease